MEIVTHSWEVQLSHALSFRRSSCETCFPFDSVHVSWTTRNNIVPWLTIFRLFFAVSFVRIGCCFRYTFQSTSVCIGGSCSGSRCFSSPFIRQVSLVYGVLLTFSSVLIRRFAISLVFLPHR